MFEQQVQELKNWLQTRIEAPETKRYLIAVSGGVDSMVLLALFEAIKNEWPIDLKVVHINHRLRDVSEAEQEFLIAYCEAHDLPLAVRVWNHPELESQVEVLARRFRYANFKQIMQQDKCDFLVTAHHQNDQAETVLMRLINGNRVTSISGIQPITAFHQEGDYNHVIRPLLNVEKSVLYAIAAAEEIPYYEDESNQELTYQRNRMRQHYFPQLEAEHLEVQAHFAGFATELQAYLSFAQERLQQLFDDYTQAVDGHLHLDIAPWIHQPGDYPMVMLHYYFKQLEIEALQQFPRQGYQDLLRFLQTSSQGEWALPDGHRLIKNYDYIYVTAVPKESKPTDAIATSTVPIDHWRPLTQKRAIRILSGSEAKSSDGWVMPLPETPLSIRNRRAGDFIRLNDGHTQKLRRYFINNKWKQADREVAQLVADETGEVYVITRDGECVYQSPKLKKESPEEMLETLRYFVLR